ncbi:MAG: hypothetical protein WCS89_03840 [Candidatus Paceibacterota bacterium]|jgi:hypothetical protein
MNGRSIIILSIAIAFLIGFLFGIIASHATLLTFDTRLSFGDVIKAVVTLLVAVLLASYLQRRAQSNNKEKEILLCHLELILDELKMFESFRETKGGKVTEIAASLKRLSIAFNTLADILRELQYPPVVISAVNFAPLISDLRHLSTETPITKKIANHAKRTKCSSEVRNGIIQWADEKRTLLDNKIQEMKTSILKAKISINRV